MEGFLNKKGRGESTFGRRNWKKRWFVLDGQYLNYYDNFDTKAGKPTSKKVHFSTQYLKEIPFVLMF